MFGESLCPACIAGQHSECYKPDIKGRSTWVVDGLKYGGIEFDCCCSKQAEEKTIKPTSLKDKILGGYKASEEVKDRTSTGRKRAAALYPIEEGMVCEWANFLYAGGGVEPVIGCRGNKISAKRKEEGIPDGLVPGAIHHGPDKDTLNNNPNNVHRICQTCHNRWHALNDPYYGDRPGDGAFLPLSGDVKEHDTETLVSDFERAYDDAYWELPKKKRLELPYRMERNNV